MELNRIAIDTSRHVFTIHGVDQEEQPALRFDERGKPHRQAVDDIARITAQTLVRQPEIAGFVVMKRPPMAAPGTPTSR